jgi:hypothetical protein
MGRRGYPPEFRRRVIDLLDAGRKVDWLYVFMAIAAPLWAVFCLAASASALMRRHRLQHAKPA